MATLLLRLAAPLQAWGADSKFETRRTLPYPTKSGVIGMLAAALGISREDDEALKRLSELKFGVRVDKEGELLRDYHTAVGEKPYITNRYYLSDAIFVAGFESEDNELLSKLEFALKNPAFPLFLGRRSCPPTMPLVLGIQEKDILSALKEEPWQLDVTTFGIAKSQLTGNCPHPSLRLNASRQRASLGKLRIITDGTAEEAFSVLQDVPVSFSKKHRKFTWRNVKDHGYVDKMPTTDIVETVTLHDPFTELG